MSFQDDRTFQGNPMLDVLSADPCWAYQMTRKIQFRFRHCESGELVDCPYMWDNLDEVQAKILYMSGFARKIQFCWFNREELPIACPCPESP